MERFTQKPILLGLATLCILLSGCNQDEIDSLTTERDNLQTQVNTLTSEKQAAETKASNAEGQVSTIQNQLTQTQNELKELKETSSADKAKIETLEGKNSDLQQQLNTVQVGLDKANAGSVDDLINQITNLQSQVKKLEGEVQTLKLANYSFKDNATVVLNAGADNLPDELQASGDAERGFSFNSTHVYVADKGANKIWYWSLDGSSTVSSLKDSEGIIAGGTFKLSDVVATENGIIASNLSINSKFKVYRWKDNDSDPDLLIEYDGKQGRFGDTFTFEGEPNGDGKLYAANKDSNNVLSWDFKSGEVVNKDNPNEIILTGLTGPKNYPHVEHIHGDKEYLLVNNTAITPTLYSHDGTQQLASINSEVVISRAVSGKIFDFNSKTYLALVTVGSEGSTVRDASILVYDVSGDDLVEAFKNLSSDKLVYQKAFGQNVNGNQAGDVDVYVDPNGEFVHLLGGATNNGFIVVKVTK